MRVVEPPGWARPEDWPLGEDIELVDTTTTADRDEVSVVHVGNNPLHRWLISRLTDRRAIAVLHDLVLHHLMVEQWGRDDEGSVLEGKLRRAHGNHGAALADSRRVGVSGDRDAFLYPARSLFVEGVGGVIVHSEWALNIIRTEFPDLPCTAVGLPAVDPGEVDRGSERRRLGFAEGEVILMHLGFLTSEKGLLQILTGLAAAVATGVRARLVLVGEGSSVQELLDTAKSIGPKRSTG